MDDNDNSIMFSNPSGSASLEGNEPDYLLVKLIVQLMIARTAKS